MKELIEYIARSLVDEVDKVEVSQSPAPGGVTRLELRVARDDMGRVIGKGGPGCQCNASAVEGGGSSRRKTGFTGRD